MGALTHTVKGPIASFRSADKAPIESLKFHFLPKQASGTPSPENPILIEGWTGCNGYGAGGNVLPIDSVMSEGYTNTLDGLTAIYSNGFIHITGNHTKAGWTNIIDFYSVWASDPIVLPPGTYNVAPPFTAVCRYEGSGWVNKGSSFTSTTSVEVRGFYAAVQGEGEKDIYAPMVMSAGSARIKEYRPYYPLFSIPITFPSSGKNIVNWPTVQNFTKDIDLYNGYDNSWIPGPIIVDKGNRGKKIVYSATIDNTSGTGDCSLHVWIKDNKNEYVSVSIVSETVRVGESKRVYAIVDLQSNSYYHVYLGLTIRRGALISYPMAEYGEEMTSYEPYSSDNTFYGGYIDPVAGEIVAEWAKQIYDGSYDELWGKLNSGSASAFAMRILTPKRYSSENSFICDSLLKIARSATWGNYDKWISDNGDYIITGIQSITTVEDWKEFLSENPIVVVYKLKTPIHIPIPSQDLQTFLDYNSFWSDMNDDTEVEYAFADRLSERKVLMQPERRLVKWNNFVNGYLSSDDWGDRDSNDTTTTFENGVSETTFLTKKRTFYTMRSKNEPRVYLSHKYLAYAEYSFDESFSQLPQIGFEFGGGKTIYGTPISLGDGWYYSRGIVSGNRNGGGYMYIPFLLVNSETDSGQKVKAKNVLYVDLTLMFGEGKEPVTSAEFLKLCEINGINIHEPHSKDITGTDQWWIIP